MTLSCKTIVQCHNEDTNIDTVKIQKSSSSTNTPYVAVL